MRIVSVIANGTTLQLGPLLASTIRDNRDAIRESRLGTIAPDDMIDLTCLLVHAAVKRTTPDITINQVADLVDTENMADLFAACWGVSMPKAQPGEAVAVASPSI
jgi:hypothetical protein